MSQHQPPLNPPSFHRREFNLCPISLNHPDDLLSGIPFHRDAVAQFVNYHQAPKPGRMNPALIPYLANPAGGPDPDWSALLRYYQNLTDGLENLQDLYLFLTRICLPNMVIDNRRLTCHFYYDHEDAPVQLGLRYDAFPFPNNVNYVGPSGEPQHALSYVVANRPIFNYPLPDGQNFLTWVITPINVGAFEVRRPTQMDHRQNLMDFFFNEDETLVRRIAGGALINRTVRVLQLYRWLAVSTERLKRIKGEVWEHKNWAGIEHEMTDGSGWTPKGEWDWSTGNENALERQ